MINLNKLQIEQVSGGYKSSVTGKYCGDKESEINCNEGSVALTVNLVVIQATVSIPVNKCRIDDRFEKKKAVTWYANKESALNWKARVIDAGCRVLQVP